jgi:hypothetical protein
LISVSIAHLIAFTSLIAAQIPAALEQMEFNQSKNQTISQPNILVAVAINATEEQLALVEQIINPSNDASIIRSADQLSSLCDLESIKKSYKITPAELSITTSANQPMDSVVAAVAGRIAIK